MSCTNSAHSIGLLLARYVPNDDRTRKKSLLMTWRCVWVLCHAAQRLRLRLKGRKRKLNTEIAIAISDFRTVCVRVCLFGSDSDVLKSINDPTNGLRKVIADKKMPGTNKKPSRMESRFSDRADNLYKLMNGLSVRIGWSFPIGGGISPSFVRWANCRWWILAISWVPSARNCIRSVELMAVSIVLFEINYYGIERCYCWPRPGNRIVSDARWVSCLVYDFDCVMQKWRDVLKYYDDVQQFQSYDCTWLVQSVSADLTWAISYQHSMWTHNTAYFGLLTSTITFYKFSIWKQS